jgi:hypothetical protein
MTWIAPDAEREYARRNGHADPIREFLDGATGY